MTPLLLLYARRLTSLHVLAARLVLGRPLSWRARTPLLSAWRVARNGAASLDHSSCSQSILDNHNMGVI